MRLIDADELLRTFTVNSDGQRIPEKDCDNFDLTISLKDIKRIIREQPTAYDLDKVVEQLEKELKLADDEKERCSRENKLQFDCAKGYAHGIAVAIEIMKEGGIS